jgi:hypothetical protein
LELGRSGCADRVENVVKKLSCQIEAETQAEIEALIKIIQENPRIVGSAAS